MSKVMSTGFRLSCLAKCHGSPSGHLLRYQSQVLQALPGGNAGCFDAAGSL